MCQRFLNQKGLTQPTLVAMLKEVDAQVEQDLATVRNLPIAPWNQHIRLSKNEMVLVRACKNWIWIGALGSAMFFHFSNLITHSF